MPHLPRSLLLAGVSTVALNCAAVAQDTDTATTPSGAEDSAFVLGDITLTADDVAGYVATGAQTTKSSSPIAEAQQSVSVVTEDQIAEQGAQNLGQALSYTAGVLAEPFGIDPRFDTPYIRGFRADNAQYVNGLRQGRYFGAVSQEIYGLQQIEVLRGPSSSLYGAGSPLGVINMVQKRARSFDFGEAGIGYRRSAELTGRRPKQRDVDPQLNAGWQNTSFRNYADHTLSAEYEQGIEELEALAAEHHVAVMCGEPMPWRCHRLLVSNTLVARGWEVVHLRVGSAPAVHELGAWGARPIVREDGTVIYPPEAQEES